MLELQQYWTGTAFLILVWGGSALLATRGFSVLFTMLKERHPDLWRELGSPTAMTRVLPEHSARVRAMVEAGDAYETDDVELRAHLARLAKTLMVSRVASVVWVIWTLALLVDLNPG